MTRVDIIVPVRNEAENIPKFVVAVESLALPDDIALGILFIEDGSTDSTVAALRHLAKENSHVRYYSMANGFGEGPAVMFGLSRSHADAMIMMEVESHPPKLIPLMIRAFQDGAQVVQCVRDSYTGREPYRDIGSAVFAQSVRLLTGLTYSKQNVYYRLMSRAFARRVLASSRYWRLLRFPLPDEASGALRIIHADMTERTAGTSQYTLRRLLGIAVDGILALISGTRMIGLSMVGAGIAGALVLVHLVIPAVLVMGGVLLLWGRFVWLRRVSYLDKLVIAESGGGGSEPIC
jgi:dolichol-phosphate mannosyltransferase